MMDVDERWNLAMDCAKAISNWMAVHDEDTRLLKIYEQAEKKAKENGVDMGTIKAAVYEYETSKINLARDRK